jgi:hypothetical protein
MVLAVNVVNAALVAMVLASWRSRPVVDLLRLRHHIERAAIGWIYYHRHRQAVEDKAKWTLFATAGSGLSGLLWGASSTYCSQIILLNKPS